MPITQFLGIFLAIPNIMLMFVIRSVSNPATAWTIVAIQGVMLAVQLGCIVYHTVIK